MLYVAKSVCVLWVGRLTVGCEIGKASWGYVVRNMPRNLTFILLTVTVMEDF